MMKPDDMPSMDAEDIGEAVGRYINRLRVQIVAQQEQIDMLKRWIADKQETDKTPF